MMVTGCTQGTHYSESKIKGETPMLYVIQILAAILIGISIGAALGPRTPVRIIGSLVGIGLGIVTIYTGSWVYLAVGTAIFLIGMAIPSSAASARA